MVRSGLAPVVGAELFTKVVSDRASRVVVDQLKAHIRVNRLDPGARLPTEQKLSDEFGVSRGVVREALRMLESSGMVTIKVGKGGGTFVASPSPALVSEGLADLVIAQNLTATTVTEAREVFEIGMLPLIIRHADEQDLVELEELLATADDALASGTYTTHHSVRFHQRLAQCTHNAALIAISHSFYEPMVMSLRTAHGRAPIGPDCVAEHRGVVEAIKARQLPRAEQVMRQHLSRTAKRLQFQH